MHSRFLVLRLATISVTTVEEGIEGHVCACVWNEVTMQPTSMDVRTSNNESAYLQDYRRSKARMWPSYTIATKSSWPSRWRIQTAPLNSIPSTHLLVIWCVQQNSGISWPTRSLEPVRSYRAPRQTVRWSLNVRRRHSRAKKRLPIEAKPRYPLPTVVRAHCGPYHSAPNGVTDAHYYM